MLNLSEIFHFGMKLRICCRYCLNTRVWAGSETSFCVPVYRYACVWGLCVPTYNRYRLPGKAQPAQDANIFTAAACWPEADKIFHTEEHHKDDLLSEGNRTDKWGRRTGGGEKKINSQMLLQVIQCSNRWTAAQTTAECALTDIVELLMLRFLFFLCVCVNCGVSHKPVTVIHLVLLIPAQQIHHLSQFNLYHTTD